MARKQQNSVVVALLVAAWCQAGFAQVPVAVLELDVENEALYHYDTTDISRMASDAGVTGVPPHGAFAQALGIGDIVAVNGQPAKGACVYKVTDLSLNPNPAARAAIADTIRLAAVDMTAEILQADGLPVGTIMLTGFFGGTRSPGAP